MLAVVAMAADLTTGVTFQGTWGDKLGNLGTAEGQMKVSVSAMLVYTYQKNIAQAFILERFFFVSICPAAIPGTCLSVFLAAVLPLC